MSIFRIVLFPLIVLTGTFLSISAFSDEYEDANTATAVFAGGCFWCTESDFEKLEGVVEAISGYIGGEAKTANYKSVTRSNTGHYEASQIIYDPQIISYSELLAFFWRHIDPTDAYGQFCDKGKSYRSAVFFADSSEQAIAEKSLVSLKKNKPFEEAIVTPLLALKTFYPAEDYHQNYYKKNPIRYRFYRHSCGRDKRVEELWGAEGK